VSAALSSLSDSDLFEPRSPTPLALRTSGFEPLDDVLDPRDAEVGEVEDDLDGLSFGAIQSVAHRQLVGSTILACIIAAVAALAALRAVGPTRYPPGQMFTAIEQASPSTAPAQHIVTLKQQR
jgi:hypothetical protein